MSWEVLFESRLDGIGLSLYLVIFPLYHSVYPLLVRAFPSRTARGRLNRLRYSWIEGLVARRDILAAAQQTRNLTMMNSLLGSAALILLGVTANVLLTFPAMAEESALVAPWSHHPDSVGAKLCLLIFVFSLAFSYHMAALRRLGHFNLVIGADPAVIEEEEGSAVDYLVALINKASNRYTLGVRAFFSAFPLFGWLFDPWIFIATTLLLGVKFVLAQDFAHLLPAARR